MIVKGKHSKKCVAFNSIKKKCFEVPSLSSGFENKISPSLAPFLQVSLHPRILVPSKKLIFCWLNAAMFKD